MRRSGSFTSWMSQWSKQQTSILLTSQKEERQTLGTLRWKATAPPVALPKGSGVSLMGLWVQLLIGSKYRRQRNMWTRPWMCTWENPDSKLQVTWPRSFNDGGKGSTYGLKDVKEIFRKSGKIHPLLCPSAPTYSTTNNCKFEPPQFHIKVHGSRNIF